MDEVLSKTHTHEVNGEQVSMKDKHFQEQRRLAATKVDVYSAPVYPVNEWLASDLIIDEIDCRTYEQDLEKQMEITKDDETIWLFRL